MNNMYQQPPPSHKHTAASGTSLVTERIAELLDQLKNEYSQMESEFSITKSQRDDYERKLEAQLAEFQNMKQTIVELEVSYQNIKQQYEDKISHLQNQLKQYQQSQSSISASPIPSSSHLQPSQSAPQPPHLMRQAPSNLPSSSSQERRGQTPPPLSAGRRSPPPLINQQPAQKKPRMGGVNSLLSSSNSSQPEDFTFPPAPGSATGSSHQGGHYSMMSSGGYSENPRPMQSGVPGISSFNNELDTNGSPTGAGMMHGDGKNGANGGGMLKKEGNDWVVVYNPQVKTNVNIQLAHNIDHHSVVCCVRFSQDGKYLATGSNRLAQIFNVETGQRIRTFPAEDISKNGAKSPSPPPKPMSPGPGEGTFDPTTMGSDKEDSFVRSVCFSPDGKYLVAGAEDKTVKVWDIKTGALKNAFHGHELDIYSLDFSSDNRYIVSGSGDGKAKIWNMETAKCEHTLGNEEIGPKEGVTSVAISPDGRTVAAGSLDCVVRLWDVQTGKFQESFVGHDDSVYSVAFSPDGKILASGSLDKTLKLWDLRSSSYRCIATLNGHRDYVLSVAFSPDGKWLISGSKDRSVQFWDPRSNVLHLMLQGHKNSVISVALNPQMPIFATGSGDYRARIWQWSAIL